MDVSLSSESAVEGAVAIARSLLRDLILAWVVLIGHIVGVDHRMRIRCKAELELGIVLLIWEAIGGPLGWWSR